ncbi:PadR family transcriptional regulator|uniref:Transcriptional regulator, PadR family n=1 Tax=Dendrosporobacter quercicolus TaxID=146817 RepID=A0A1G9RUK7_9FIRM|nr:PadR family transcriptional regulator [Dendrosporobacter quercicolus]NSL49347.1 PadR family transcriptional regulator [Dendrosporobacter quercicolus DSM 1736]SDM26677.1 transcriptional regulator, PadR family [Dendrosporobacter quercicolus]
MQLAKMVALGALEALGTASGYDIFQFLAVNQIDKWTDIQKPSIYYALRQLEKERAVEGISRLREGKYPEKVMYRLTTKGVELFDRLQEKAFLGIYPRFYGFKLALKFNIRRSAAEIEVLANRAVTAIDRQLAMMEKYLSGLPAGERERNAFFIEHDRRLFTAERQWILEAAEWVKTGQ